jgi:DNA end-binding protein Ku
MLRASWTGYLRLSLITIPVRLFNAISSADKIALNQLHKDCNSRLKQKMICPTHGEVERDQIVKGYEYEKDNYVVVEDSDLKAMRLETTKVIELVSFANASQLDPIFLDAPYYVSPDGPVAEEGFRVMREAMRELNRVAIGRVVLSGREHIVALGVQEKGLRMSTLRYASEIKAAAPYFEDIKNGNVNAAQLGLAKQLVEQFTADFKPEEFSDRYRDALMEVIKTKMDGAGRRPRGEGWESGQFDGGSQAKPREVASAQEASRRECHDNPASREKEETRMTGARFFRR